MGAPILRPGIANESRENWAIRRMAFRDPRTASAQRFI